MTKFEFHKYWQDVKRETQPGTKRSSATWTRISRKIYRRSWSWRNNEKRRQVMEILSSSGQLKWHFFVALEIKTSWMWTQARSEGVPCFCWWWANDVKFTFRVCVQWNVIILFCICRFQEDREAGRLRVCSDDGAQRFQLRQLAWGNEWPRVHSLDWCWTVSWSGAFLHEEWFRHFPFRIRFSGWVIACTGYPIHILKRNPTGWRRIIDATVHMQRNEIGVTMNMHQDTFPSLEFYPGAFMVLIDCPFQ